MPGDGDEGSFVVTMNGESGNRLPVLYERFSLAGARRHKEKMRWKKKASMIAGLPADGLFQQAAESHGESAVAQFRFVEILGENA